MYKHLEEEVGLEVMWRPADLRGVAPRAVKIEVDDLAGRGASSGAVGVSRNNRLGGTSRYFGGVQKNNRRSTSSPSPPELSLIATIMIQFEERKGRRTQEL